jgi:hypothetical protein
MGYSTYFTGKFKLNKQLTLDDYQWLKDFEENNPGDVSTYPSSRCGWMPSKGGRSIEWNGNDKFYDYLTGIDWLIKSFFKPKGYILNGEVAWRGQESEDVGKIIIKNNVRQGKKTVLPSSNHG